MAAQLPSTDRQSITESIRRVVNGLNGLVELHVQLVKQELKEEARKAIGAGKTLGIGVGIGVVGALVLLNALMMMIVLGLNELGGMFIPYIGPFLGWLVGLVLIGVIFLVAYRLVIRGIHEVKISPLVETRETLREDIEWARQLLTRSER